VPHLFQPFLTLLATSADSELARQVEYLKAENRVLRAKLPSRLKVSDAERAELVKLGKPLGKALKNLIGIVSPRTFARWVNGETKTKETRWPCLGARPAARAVQSICRQVSETTARPKVARERATPEPVTGRMGQPVLPGLRQQGQPGDRLRHRPAAAAAVTVRQARGARARHAPVLYAVPVRDAGCLATEPAARQPSVGESLISSESRMREIRPSGSMSGRWKRSMVRVPEPRRGTSKHGHTAT